MDYLPLLNSLALIVVTAGLSFLAARYWFMKNATATRVDKAAAAFDAQNLRIVELEKQLALVGAAVVPIATAFQAILIKELTHFHTPEMDALMKKLGPPYELTDREYTRLIVLLKEREVVVDGLIEDSERDAAHILPVIIKRARAEAERPEASIAASVAQVVRLPEEAPEITPVAAAAGRDDCGMIRAVPVMPPPEAASMAAKPQIPAATS